MISRSGPSARLVLFMLAATLSCGTALAQGSATGSAATGSAATAPATADPVVARVNGQAIHLSDVKAAAAGLPANLRALPPDQIYPKLLDSMVSAQALAEAARKAGVDKDPAVQRQVQSATDQVLDNALLAKVVLPTVTDQALQARYQKEIAGKSGAEEVHARHILVDSEDQAKQIIAELNKGADFGALAKKYSKDPGAADGGDLGFFKRDEMVPAFSDAAFALKPGQYTQTPVHTQFGWHVILVEARRQATPPSFEQAKDQLRQEMLKESVQQEIAKARAAADVQVFNLDGSPMRVTDTAVPPKPKQ